MIRGVLKQESVTIPAGRSRLSSLLASGKWESRIWNFWIAARGAFRIGSSTVESAGANDGLPIAADDDVIGYVDSDGADDIWVNASAPTTAIVVQFG